MANDFPQAGQVFDYHYLWKWQDEKGETEGRKKRPCCMALVVMNAEGQHVLFIAPITSKRPDAGRLAIAIPETELHRAKLDSHVSLWVIVDELNADVLEASYTLEDRNPRGQFGPAFTDTVLRAIQSVRKNGKLSIAERT
ncbi:hypothetical protein [Cognatiyoonia sp. IB215182]|uniref:hypothetical protein n=1 Tax=Cognatiyoonia sp. IB215182 TaxID=3097353 RepID=UPI002A12F839|nr:hypothetical protein [Cognatiyoonia sp. IB215182]MDX8355291.1 hypothetical protein [Cognatiyoonia sp. IB215182]